jgi:hypothetical protein
VAKAGWLPQKQSFEPTKPKEHAPLSGCGGKSQIRATMEECAKNLSEKTHAAGFSKRITSPIIGKTSVFSRSDSRAGIPFYANIFFRSSLNPEIGF